MSAFNILIGHTATGSMYIFNAGAMRWENSGASTNALDYKVPAGPMIHIAAQVNAQVHCLVLKSTQIVTI